MEDRERKRIMQRMIVRESKRERRMVREKERHTRRRREKDLIKTMSAVALNPLCLTIFGLLDSCRVSIDPGSHELLLFALYGVKESVELVKFLEEFRDRMESKRMKVLEGEIREAAWELEKVLDTHVSDQFLLQYETESIQLGGDERGPLLFSLNLQGIEQHIDGFIQKVMQMEKLLDPWFDEEEGEGGSGGGKESEIFGLSDQSGVSVTRSWFMSWFGTKAASIFFGMKEEYIEELEKLLPEEEDGDDYADLFTWAFTRCTLDDRFNKIKDELIIWWINKAASIFILESDYTQQLVNPLPDDEDEDDDDDDDGGVSSRTGCALNMSNMVGLTDLFCQLRYDLTEDVSCFRVGAIVGMVGIGKTTFVKKLLQDPLILSMFECCIFVRIGQKYQWDEIMQAILAQMPDVMVGHGDLNECLYETLKDKKYLIVFDDVWDSDLVIKLVNNYLTRGWILLTTRINGVAHSDGRRYQVPFLNKEESWDLLRGKIFGEMGCPHELEKAGKKIAENCEGLPLLIVTVADLLSRADQTTLEYWTKIAADKTNSIFIGAYDQIYEVAYPSYSHLPQHLKACFLYLGAFPQNDEFRLSKLINMWSADGFLGVFNTLLQGYANVFLAEIVSNNVALAAQLSSVGHGLKACSLHSVFWYLCKREARNEKFLHVLNSYKDATVEDIEFQRRLSFYKNSILSRKDVRDSIASISAVHSLLCTGPYHQYQVPICFGLRLLKVLDALTIRFYGFPLEIVKLVQLRYLALTCNGNLPPSISNLWSLQCLIVHPHLSIKTSISQSYLPVEIWHLQELEYLQIIGRNLPDPPPGVILRELLVLLDVGADTCNARVLGSIPNLEKLRVQIELMPGSAEPLRFCDDVSHLQELSSLQFVVVNPELMFETVAPAPFVSFSKLRKLTLSGLGYPWEAMNSIAELFYLQELKLKCYAFRGIKWEAKEAKFWKLEYLSIEDTDLVQWTGGKQNFTALRLLSIKNCYKLQEIPQLSSYLREIRLVDCNPSAVTCAKQMAPKSCHVYADSSWLSDGKLS